LTSYIDPLGISVDGDGRLLANAIVSRSEHNLPAALIDRPQGYFPVPALRQLDEPFLTTVWDALYAAEAKERDLLRPQSVERLLVQPNDQRTRTGANSLWVLSVLEMWLHQHGVG
jgi:asparagine synthase (glutamine-hydrolysing)